MIEKRSQFNPLKPLQNLHLINLYPKLLHSNAMSLKLHAANLSILIELILSRLAFRVMLALCPKSNVLISFI
jgi:hypothetical protein